jgi:CrcB protein
MSVAVLLAVGVLGGLGAIARFVLDGAVSARTAGRFPFGTLAVNVSGSFALGLFVSLALAGDGYRLLGTGLVGGFTTFSTWALESHRLGEDGELALGAVNFAVSLLLGVVGAWAGRKLGGGL